MRITNVIQVSANGRFKKFDIDGVIVSVERSVVLDREKIRALIREDLSLEELGERLLASLQMDEMVVERNEEVFMSLKKPINLFVDGQLTVKVPEKITPCVVLSASPSEEKKVLVFSKRTEPARKVVELFEDMVEKPHHLPAFIQEAKNAPEILGVVGVVGKVVGTWGKFQLELV